jgi:uncharacterized protein with HEPN domain
MSKKIQLRLINYLEHILDAIQRIHEYTKNMTELTFIQNQLVQDAVIRNFEIIGESSQNIKKHFPDFAIKHSDLPLNFAYEMRNALAHGYFNVDLEIVWRTIEKDIPKLEKQVKKIYNNLRAE